MATVTEERPSAQTRRGRDCSEMSGILVSFNVLISPFALRVPPTLNDLDGVERFGQYLPLRSVGMPFSAIQNICRMPASVVRVGFDDDGVPIGIQVGRRIGHEGLSM
ncbi:MAG: amidase family protein [Acidimicrobiales bacterium]